MRNYRAQDVDSYIASSDAAARPHLKEPRKIIRSTIPNAEEKISWGIPFYKYHSKDRDHPNRVRPTSADHGDQADPESQSQNE